MKTSSFKAILSFELLVAIVMMLLAYCSFGQTVSPVQPKTQVQVHKYLDDKGHMIGYDSVYTYSWSGRIGDADQVQHDFKQLGKAGVSPFTSPFGRYQWYFNKDFSSEMARMREEMRRSMQEMMDAIKLRQNAVDHHLNGKVQPGEKTL